jgi:hypothetical protein
MYTLDAQRENATVARKQSGNPERRELPVQSRWRPDTNPFRRYFPHMDIGLIVADIVKPTLTEPLGKKARFVASGDVCRGAGAEPAGKKSEMARDSGYETFVAGRCEIDWAARFYRLADEAENRLVIGQGSRIKVNALRYHVLEMGFPSAQSK